MIKMNKQLLITTLLTVVFIGCTEMKKGSEEETKVEPKIQAVMAAANLEPKNGSSLDGGVVFLEEDGKVTMRAEISGISEGSHAIHIHETGDCSAEDGSSAGGHWNPTGSPHGKWGTEKHHRGDIGNIEVGPDGNGHLTRETDQWCLTCDDANKFIMGRSIIIHEGPDDFTSQPSGNAGARIGCGKIIFSENVHPADG
jgi:Cu-Zn family superoxide dismutase